MTANLKPCPFCGSSDIKQEYNGPHGYEPYVVCVDCGCCVDGKFGAWNTRAAVEAPGQEPDETAALRAKLAEVERECDFLKGELRDAEDRANAFAAKEMRTEKRAIHAESDRDEERKLADDLAMSLTEVSSRCGPLAEDGKRAKAVLARHAARRKEQQG